jgi:hypothetical protein
LRAGRMSEFFAAWLREGAPSVCFEVWLESDPNAKVEHTCGHRHAQLEEAFECARQLYPVEPPGVLRFDGDQASYVGAPTGGFVFAWWGSWRGGQQ